MDSNHFDGCSAVSNGRIYCKPALSATYSGYCGELMSAAGTVSCTKGSTIVTGIGTAFTTMGIRNTYFGDFIRVGTGTDSQYLQIDSVDSDTQLRVGERRTPTLSLSGQEFAVAVGNGYMEALHADNNFNHLTGGLWRSNAGAAMQIGGLYGPLIDHPQIDTIGFYGISVNFTRGGTQTYHTTILHPYFEGTQASPFLFASAYGISVIQPMVLGSQEPHYTSATWNTGVWIDQFGMRPIGNGGSSLPTSKGWNLANEGTFKHGAANAGPINSASTIPVTGSLVAVGPGGPVTMTAEPTLSEGVDGREVTIINQGIGAITFQDRKTLPGSALRLAAPAITLMPYSSLRLIWFNSSWNQVGFTSVL